MNCSQLKRPEPVQGDVVQIAWDCLRAIMACVPEFRGTAAEVPVGPVGEMDIRRAFLIVRDEQVRRGLIDPFPEALIAYTKTLEMLRRADARSTETLRMSVRPNSAVVLPRTAISGVKMAYVSGIVERFSEPVLGDLCRLTLTTKCEDSEQSIICCEWEPNCLSFAAGVCEVTRPQGRSFSDAKAKLFCMRLALEVTEEMFGGLGESDTDILKSFFRIVGTKRIEIARRAGLFGAVMGAERVSQPMPLPSVAALAG